MGSNGVIRIEPHTQRKYIVLRKYLDVCHKFHCKYKNFVYVDTHGGSGRVLLKGRNISVEGSPLIAAAYTPDWPCHIVEIDPDTYGMLRQAVDGHPNVVTYLGDCNSIIHQILGSVPKWKNFVCCFVDPDGLVYHGSDGYACDQLKADTVRAISEFPRSELLLNFPLEAITRCAGVYFGDPNGTLGQADGCRVTSFMGSEEWQGLPLDQRNRRGFLDLYLLEVLGTYPFKGALLVRSTEKNLPLYYLIYATHNQTAAKIMRDVMKKESGYVLPQNLFTLKPRTLDETHPLNRFIFDD